MLRDKFETCFENIRDLLIDRAYRQRGKCELLIQRHYSNHIFQFYTTKKVKGHYCAKTALKKGQFFAEKGHFVKFGGHVPPVPSGSDVPAYGITKIPLRGKFSATRMITKWGIENITHSHVLAKSSIVFALFILYGSKFTQTVSYIVIRHAII